MGLLPSVQTLFGSKCEVEKKTVVRLWYAVITENQKITNRLYSDKFMSNENISLTRRLQNVNTNFIESKTEKFHDKIKKGTQ